MSSITIKTKRKDDILTSLDISLAARAAERMEVHNLVGCWACCGQSISYAKWDGHWNPLVIVGSREQFKKHEFGQEDGRFGTVYIEEA